MRRTLAGFMAGVLACALACFPTRADASARGDAARAGAQWLAGEQQDDGGFFSSGQRVDQVAETIAAAIAGGVSGRPVKRAVAYLRKHAVAGSTRGAYTGRIVAGLVAAGENPRSFADTDLVAKLAQQYDEGSGAYDTENLFTNLMGANGALAAGAELPSRALAYIKEQECGNGGFGFENGCAKGPDVDTSAWVINVLVAAGRKDDPAVASAKTYILSVQRDDGGFGFTTDKSTSSDSTGLVLSAIEALGEKTTKAPWRQDDGDDPVKALLPLQHSSGGFRFVGSSKSPNALSTNNAVPGLARVAYPVPKVDVTATPKPSAAPRTAAPRTAAPRANGGGTVTQPRPPSFGGSNAPGGSTATTTATQPSPGGVGAPGALGGAAASPGALRSFEFTPGPVAPFGDNTSSEPAETIPAPVLWAGLGGALALGGGATYLFRRWRRAGIVPVE